MARYRRIDPHIWHDDKFPSLSDDAKLLFFHLITTPRGNPLGCFVQGKTDMAEYLNWSMRRLSTAFSVLISVERVKYDDSKRLVLLPNYLKYNPLENENQAKMALKYLVELPYNSQFFQYLKLFLEQYGKQFLEPLITGIDRRNSIGNGIENSIGNGMPITEPYSLTLNLTPEPNTPISPKKSPPSLVFPDWLPSEQWEAYLDMRKSIKRTLTEHGIQLAINELSKLRDAGHDPAAILNQSTFNNWKGLFALKEDGKKAGQQVPDPDEIHHRFTKDGTLETLTRRDLDAEQKALLELEQVAQ